jgi:hypothetical protein
METGISLAWDKLSEGLPTYNVVKLSEGLKMLYFYADSAMESKDVEKLEIFCKLLGERTEKLEEHESSQRVEEISFRILMDDIGALYRITMAAYEKLKKESNPHYVPSSADVSFLTGLAKKYAKTKDKTLLASFDKEVADIMITGNVEKARVFKAAIGEIRRTNEDHIGSLCGYETALTQFLLLKRALDIR